MSALNPALQGSNRAVGGREVPVKPHRLPKRHFFGDILPGTWRQPGAMSEGISDLDLAAYTHSYQVLEIFWQSSPQRTYGHTAVSSGGQPRKITPAPMGREYPSQ